MARLFVECALTAEAAVVLDARQAHYLGRVLRLGAGARVRFFNGRDGEWEAELARVRSAGAEARVVARVRAQASGPDVWIVYAALKRRPTDFLVEKATEMGAALLWPIVTRRTVVERAKLERLRAIAIEAAEQCERLSVPEIRPLTPLDAVLSAWPAERRILLLDEQRHAAPIAQALAALDPRAAAAPWAVLTGPEGGWDPAELDVLRERPIVSPAALGPRLLRAETASLAALACWQAQLGDWRAPRVPPSTS